MSTTIVLKSFQELASVLKLEELPPGPAEEPNTPSVPSAEGVTTPHGEIEDAADGAQEHPASDLADLLARLDAAAEMLAAAGSRDRERREQVARDLRRYDELLDERRAAEQALDCARTVRAQAEALLAGAFDLEARSAAEQVVELAAQGERGATHLLDACCQQAAELEARPDVQRLIEDRRRQEEAEAERRKAAELEAARRLSDGLARARETLAAGRVEEAEAQLGELSREHPNSAEVASLLHKIAHERWLVKANGAEDALREARKAHRRDPRAAIDLIEPLETTQLPEPLSRQVFGLWARCHALLGKQGALLDPLRYAPDPGRGLILARETSDGSYVVASALGMGAGWRTGQPVPERVVRRARPLR